MAGDDPAVMRGQPDLLGFRHHVADRGDQPVRADHHPAAGPFRAERLRGEGIRRHHRLHRHDGAQHLVQVELVLGGVRAGGRRDFPFAAWHADVSALPPGFGLECQYRPNRPVRQRRSACAWGEAGLTESRDAPRHPGCRRPRAGADRAAAGARGAGRGGWSMPLRARRLLGVPFWATNGAARRAPGRVWPGLHRARRCHGAAGGGAAAGRARLRLPPPVHPAAILAQSAAVGEAAGAAARRAWRLRPGRPVLHR